MSVKIYEIRNRYRDVMCEVNDTQMFEDIRTLLAYVEVLHSIFAKQAQLRAVEEAERFLEEPGSGMHLPN